MTVDYDTLDPLVRRDSYRDTSPSHTGELVLYFLNYFFLSLSVGFIFLCFPLIYWT